MCLSEDLKELKKKKSRMNQNEIISKHLLNVEMFYLCNFYEGLFK